MITLKKFIFQLFFILSIQSIYAQASFEVQIKTDAVSRQATRFYVEGVTDARKEPINNGYAFINKKKVGIIYPGGVPNQFQQYLNALLPAADTTILAVVINIKKLVLTERTSARGNIAKTELTIQFLRKYNDELTQLFELNTWMEQSALKDASILQEKNIRDILGRMMVQFNKFLSDHPDDPQLAHHIEFKVIHPTDDNLQDDTIYWARARKLEWEDFHGLPTDEIFAAQSNCAFGQGIQPTVENGIGIFYITIRAAFLKKGSWFRKDQNSDEVLLHEQLHFDIAEWQIRNLRKSIINSRFNLNTYADVINKLYENAWNTYSVIQSAYDDETVHGTKKEEQEKWNLKVIKGLNDLSDYE